MLLELQTAPAADEQVVDQDYHCDDKHKVNETAADVKAEAQKPQNHKDDKDCPKHIFLLSALQAPRAMNLPERPR